MAVGDIDAAFTADEARSVADERRSRAIGTNCGFSPNDFRDYVHDPASGVDGEPSVKRPKPSGESNTGNSGTVLANAHCIYDQLRDSEESVS